MLTYSIQARQYLEANDWNLEGAVSDFYASQEDDSNDPDYEDESEGPTATTQPAPSGGRRLGDGPSHPPAFSSSQPIQSQPKKKPPTAQKKFATLGDYNSAGQGHDEHDGDHNPDLFAGGEKSGLAVTNPDDLKKKILEKAITRQRPPEKEEKAKADNFRGAARTLGGDDTPSVEVASAPAPAAAPTRVDRVLHFWNDGFSIDDGELYRTDDPRNADILNGIRQGRAPLHIMNVLPGQEVDVEIKPHDENYVKPKKKYVPFGGQGNRLGSPTPGLLSMPGAFSSEPTASSTSVPTTAARPEVSVDDTQPTVTLRISLGDGTRLTSRFNTMHTIGDVYDFVRRADTTGRPFVLQTTFPTKVLENQQEVLGDMPDFKRGGTVVQKYT